MTITTDHYSYTLPDEHAATIISGIADDGTRERVLSAVDASEPGKGIRLPLSLADALLNAFAEWERAQEGEGE